MCVMSPRRVVGSVLCSVLVGWALGAHVGVVTELGEGRASSAAICVIALVARTLACLGGLVVLCLTAGEGYDGWFAGGEGLTV